jgi:hypothetical protein
MQEHLKNPSAAFRKAYLRLYVARIELGDDQIKIFGARDALTNSAENPQTEDAAPVRSLVRERRAVAEPNLSAFDWQYRFPKLFKNDGLAPPENMACSPSHHQKSI